MTIEGYISSIKKRFSTGISREHAYRGDLQQLLETMLPDTIVTNEPARISCGSPDYVITRKDIPIGYIEAKDIGVELAKVLKSSQLKRYMASLDNLILTDYIRFVFIKDGVVYETIDLFELSHGLFSDSSVEEQLKRHERFAALIQDFAEFITQTIKSPTKLASMMANKAKLLAQVINNALTSDVESNANSSLKDQMEAFKQVLIHDIKPGDFADIYAQTIAYGMFAARLHDPTPDTFSRQEAASLIPKSNPFLRKLFQYISGYDIDDRIEWIVSALADIFRATDVAAILKDFGKATQMNDPFIHFYEFFLAEYDPKLRKARGVWYTPEPVVNFIVRAVDDVLKSEFGLAKGLADNSKTKVKIDTQNVDARSKTGYKQVEKEVHRVQILDPATGTGTFLAEVVKHIYSTKFKNMQGAWPQYVENDLIPRLNGFEILMASYAMAHLKLDLLLGETGYKATSDQRFKIYLTNSLEEADPATGTLFANWLSSEASEANAIKRDTPVMCVIGNPPYSGESQNKGDWIMSLMESYKMEPGGKIRLKERNPKAINDDYIKFIRYGQYLIEKNGEGVLAFINPHGFLDNPTFRGVRWQFLKAFDKIYSIDLHGNSLKKEMTPTGGKDENVFDIQQGVSINIFIKIKGSNNDKLGAVYKYDLYGKRKDKYDFLNQVKFLDIKFQEIDVREPMFYMVDKDYSNQKKYDSGFGIDNLFILYGMGIATGDDEKYIDFEKSRLQETFGSKYIEKINYRVFDKRYINNDYDMIERGRKQLMSHFLLGSNIGLISLKRARKNFQSKFSVVSYLTDKSVVSTLDNGYVFPFFVYKQDIQGDFQKELNMRTEVLVEIQRQLKYTCDLKDFGRKVASYIYACLYSSEYRTKYEEFLKTDFPKIPYPESPHQFEALILLGERLIDLHLFDNELNLDTQVLYCVTGDNVVTRKMTKTSIGFESNNTITGTGKVWINDLQYFDNVPEQAWNFYIGGFQPAQKWLKDRQGRTLTYDDIEHYQKIIAALVETDKIMKEIDEVGVV